MQLRKRDGVHKESLWYWKTRFKFPVFFAKQNQGSVFSSIYEYNVINVRSYTE